METNDDPTLIVAKETQVDSNDIHPDMNYESSDMSQLMYKNYFTCCGKKEGIQIQKRWLLWKYKYKAAILL